MKIAIVHNEYGKFSGEEAVVQNQVELLESNGHLVSRFTRNSSEISDDFLGHAKAFFSGIHSPASVRKFEAFLSKEKPDLVHIHNLYPLISPSILDICRKHQLPVVMTVHNYRLVCPNGLFMVDGAICERCTGGKEYWCVLRNCEGSYFKSLGYALRNAIARLRKSYIRNVSFYMVLSSFQKTKLVKAGLFSNRIVSIPNMCKGDSKNFKCSAFGEYIAYVGRISKEKGISTLVDAIKLCPEIFCKIAGSGPYELPCVSALPNCEPVGFLEEDPLLEFFRNSRFLVFPSICYETFGLTIVEAMLQGKAVIASRIGGIPEVVDNGKTGLLFEPGDAQDLAEKIRSLWASPELCGKMGEAGREKALREYSAGIYYKRLVAVYSKAIGHANTD